MSLTVKVVDIYEAGIYNKPIKKVSTYGKQELYLGGKIMAARILCDHLTDSEKPLSEENWVVIVTGPLTGTGTPSTARFGFSGWIPALRN